jgi:hypothetical protein
MFRVPLGTYLVADLAIALVIAGTGSTIIATMIMGKMPGIMSDANEANRTREGIANAKPTTGIDDIHPKSIFFKVLPGENRRIHDSARGRVWNWACARRGHPAPLARAL